MSPPVVHPKYFARVGLEALSVPIVWVSWGIAGYFPHVLEPYLSDDIFEMLLTFRVSRFTITVCVCSGARL